MAYPTFPDLVTPWPSRLIQSRDTFDASVADLDRFFTELEAYLQEYGTEADQLRAALIAANLPDLTSFEGRKFRINDDATGLQFIDAYIPGTPTTATAPGAGTYTPPSDALALIIEGVGGGAGGGGAASVSGIARAAGGGGGGAWGQFLLLGPLSPLNYVVGAGGAGAPDSDTDGTVGGDTTITSLGLIFYGGLAGRKADTSNLDQYIARASGRTLGPAFGGGLTLLGTRAGEEGGTGMKISAESRATGAGGNSQYGVGGPTNSVNSSATSSVGVDGRGFGAGGSGGLSSTTQGRGGGAGTGGWLSFTPLY